MAGLRYTVMADEVLKGISETYPELRNPLRRQELATAIHGVYVSADGDRENREAIRLRAMAELGHPEPEQRSRETGSLGDIHVVNILSIVRGAVTSVDIHYVTFSDHGDIDDIEDFLAAEGREGRKDAERTVYDSIFNNIPFDMVQKGTTIRFLSRVSGKIAETGRFVA